MRTTVLRALLLGTAAALALAGCTSDKSTPHHRASASASPSASARHHAMPRSQLTVTMAEVTLSKKQKPAAAVVLEYWKRYGAAVSTRDLTDSGLDTVVTASTGVAGTKKVVENLKSKHQHYRGRLVLTMRAFSFGGDTATVSACVDQSRSKLVDEHGKTVAEPEKKDVLPVSHTLVRHGRTWLVDRLEQGTFSC